MPDNDLLSHGNSHTTIGAKQFHFWVRDGIRWYLLAIVIRQTGVKYRCCLQHLVQRYLSILWKIGSDKWHLNFDTDTTLYRASKEDVHLNIYLTISRTIPYSLSCFSLPSQSEGAISRSSYMIKPHEQLVLVSFIHYWTSTSSLSTS